MPSFERQLNVPVSRQSLHDWHLRAGAFERLTAPWQTVRTVRAEPVAEGAVRIFELKKAGVWLRWVAEHRDVVSGERFSDVQLQGPFKSWAHTHRFEQIDAAASRLVDRIDYELPLGRLGSAVAGRSVRSDLQRMFAYRHRVTLDDLTQHAHYGRRAPWRVAVSGASGFIGQQLVAFLRTGGHEVWRLVRHRDSAGDDEIRWSIGEGVQDRERLEGLDAIIHLAGASVAQRWTDAARREIHDSRVLGTRALVDAVAGLTRKPRVLLAASAVGYYGDTGTAVVEELAPRGEGFLAQVCDAWEAEIRRAEDHCRTARMRLGVVMDPRGGALAKLLPPFRAGVGGRLGKGEQLVSWVALDDVLGAFLCVLHDDQLAGAINVTGPEPVTQAELARTLGAVLGRPAVTPAPSRAIELMFGDMGRETVLASTGARPARLLSHGYRFRLPSLDAALRHALGR